MTPAVLQQRPHGMEVGRTKGTAGSGPVVVVDFGGQYAQLIARRIRELGACSIVVPAAQDAATVAAHSPAAIVLSGGPASVYEPGAPPLPSGLLDLGVPVLGICYGMQLLALGLGGEVHRTGQAEFGATDVMLSGGGPLFAGLAQTQTCWMSHRDAVAQCPPGAQVTARSSAGQIAGFDAAARHIYAVQFHPEVAHTEHGTALLSNFLFEVAHVSASWTPDDIIESQVRQIRERVGTGKVLCALSGGVDSTVAAALTHRAVGDSLTCVFVDHGLLRAGEAQAVVRALRDHLDVQLVHVDASRRFLEALNGIEDPEQKRKIIGREFIRVFEEAAPDVGGDGAAFLVQGTLYSDVVESGAVPGSSAATIKSHHNVGGLPDDLGLELVEPLRMLFKDEVRRVGQALGLPQSLVRRQPFPGPGLAIRIVGEVTPERVEIVRAADAIVQQEVRAAGLEHELWQAFAVLLGIRSVGVQGDERTYAYPVVLRAVVSDDAMTADWARLPDDLLQRISGRVINEVAGVNRVVLDISSKPPATIEWE